MKRIAIIPARGGSKRLPRKNIKDLAGKPLVRYTIDAVIASGVFDKVLLSSDDGEILSIGENIDGLELHRREAVLATDTTKVWDLVDVICRDTKIRHNYDVVGLFLPTCPFRTASDIREAISKLDNSVDGVVMVSKLRDHIEVAVGIDDSGIMDATALNDPSPLLLGKTRSQEYRSFYRPNGGIYLKRIETFLKDKSFFTGKIGTTILDDVRSVDIDNEIDFRWAQFLLGNGYIKL